MAISVCLAVFVVACIAIAALVRRIVDYARTRVLELTFKTVLLAFIWFACARAIACPIHANERFVHRLVSSGQEHVPVGYTGIVALVAVRRQEESTSALVEPLSVPMLKRQGAKRATSDIQHRVTEITYGLDRFLKKLGTMSR